MSSSNSNHASTSTAFLSLRKPTTSSGVDASLLETHMRMRSPVHVPAARPSAATTTAAAADEDLLTLPPSAAVSSAPRTNGHRFTDTRSLSTDRHTTVPLPSLVIADSQSKATVSQRQRLAFVKDIWRAVVNLATSSDEGTSVLTSAGQDPELACMFGDSIDENALLKAETKLKSIVSQRLHLMDRLRDELNRERQTREQLEAQHGRVLSMVDEAQLSKTEANRRAAANDQARSELARMKAHVQQLELELSLTRKNSLLPERHRTLENDLEAQRTEHLRDSIALREQNRQAEIKLTRLREENAALAHKIETLNTKNDSLEASLRIAQNLAAEEGAKVLSLSAQLEVNQDLMIRVQELQKDISSERERASALEQALQECKEHCLERARSAEIAERGRVTAVNALDQLAHELEDLRRQNNDRVLDIRREAQEQVDQSNDRLRQANRCIAELEAQLSESRRWSDLFSQDVATLKDEHQSMQKQDDANMERLETSIKNLEREVSNLAQDLENARLTENALKDELEHRVQSVRELNTSNRQHDEDLARERREHVSTMKALREASSARDRLAKQLDAEHQRVLMLEADKLLMTETDERRATALHQAEANADELQQEVARLQRQVADADRRKEELSQELLERKREADRCAHLESEIEHIRRVNNDVVASRSRLEEELETTRNALARREGEVATANERAQQLEQTLEATRASSVNLTRQISVIQQQLHLAQSDLSTATRTADQECSRLREEVSQLQQRIDQLNTVADNARNSVEEQLRQTQHALNDMHQRLESSVAQHEQEQLHWQQRLRDAQAACALAENERDEAVRTADSLRQQQRSRDKEVKHTEQQLRRKSADLAAAEQRLELIGNEQRDRSDRLVEATEKVERISRERMQVEAALSDTRISLSTTQAERDMARAMVDELRHTVNLLEARVNDNDRSTLREKLGLAEQDAHHWQERTKLLDRRIIELQSDNDSLRKLRIENETLQTRVKSLHLALNRLSQHFRACRQAMDGVSDPIDILASSANPEERIELKEALEEGRLLMTANSPTHSPSRLDEHAHRLNQSRSTYQQHHHHAEAPVRYSESFSRSSSRQNSGERL